MSDSEIPVIDTALVSAPKTPSELQLELAAQASHIAWLEKQLREANAELFATKADYKESIERLLDSDLKYDPVVRGVAAAYAAVNNAEDAVESVTKVIALKTEVFRETAKEYAPSILPTLTDKTILRGADKKAVISVAEKLKEDRWNPIQAFQFADSNPSTKKYIIRTVDEDSFKKDIRAGYIKDLPGGIYEFHIEHEVRIMGDALKNFSQ